MSHPAATGRIAGNLEWSGGIFPLKLSFAR
jgi:hypothetical protein